MEDFSYINRGRGKVLLYDGYQYTKKKTYKNEAVWWRCCNFLKKKCRGSVTIKDDQLIKETAHAQLCIQNPSLNIIAQKFDICKKKNKAPDCTPIPTLYNETIAELQDTGLDIICDVPSFDKVRSGLYKARNKHYGVDKLIHKDASQITVPHQFASFLLADYNCNGIRILLFSSEEAKININQVKHMFGDGTFKVCPQPFLQLYTLHGDVGSSLTCPNIVPVIYALMTHKTYECYVILFEMLKSQFPYWNPSKFTTDFEEAVMKAVVTVLPGIALKGCHFHFTRCIWRKLDSLKLRKDKQSRRCASLCNSLPFLPENLITEGWNYIINEYEKYPEIQGFLTYFQKFWMRASMIPIWCIWRERHRTTNSLEGWHHKINSVMRRKNNNIVHLLNALQKDAAFYTLRRRQLTEEDSPPSTNGKKQMQILLKQRYILDCQLALLNGQISVGHFLDKTR